MDKRSLQEERKKWRDRNICPGEYLRTFLAVFVDEKEKRGSTKDELNIINNVAFNIAFNGAGSYCGCDNCLRFVDQCMQDLKDSEANYEIVTKNVKQEPRVATCDIDCDHEPMH